MEINPFLTNVAILYPLGTLARNGLKKTLLEKKNLILPPKKHFYPLRPDISTDNPRRPGILTLKIKFLLSLSFSFHFCIVFILLYHLQMWIFPFFIIINIIFMTTKKLFFSWLPPTLQDAN